MIGKLPTDEKPRERCLNYGPECLSLRECFAILLGSGPKGEGCLGLARQLLNPEGLLDTENEFFRRMASYSEASLQGINGLGPAGRAKFLVTMEIAKRYAHFQQSQRQTLLTDTELPKEVLMKIPNSMSQAQEEIIGFIPHFSDKTIGRFQVVQEGTATRVIFEAQHFLRLLLFSKAEGFWMFHNHVNHCQEVSEADQACTRQIKTLSRLLGIQFYGHWIIAGQQLVKI